MLWKFCYSLLNTIFKEIFLTETIKGEDLLTASELSGKAQNN